MGHRQFARSDLQGTEIESYLLHMVDMLRADLEASSSPVMRASSDAKGNEPNARSVAATRPSLCRFPRLAPCCGLLVVIGALLVGLFVGWRLRPKDGIVSDLLCPNVFDGPPLCHELLDLPGFLAPGSLFHEQCQEKCNEKDSNVSKVCRVVKAKPGLIPCTTVLDVKETAKALARQIGMEYRKGQSLREVIESVVTEDLNGAARSFFWYLRETRLDALFLNYLENPDGPGQLTPTLAPYLLSPFGTGAASLLSELGRSILSIPAIAHILYNSHPSASIATAELLNLLGRTGIRVPSLVPGALGLGLASAQPHSLGLGWLASSLLGRDTQLVAPDALGKLIDPQVYAGQNQSLAVKLTPTPDDWSEYVEKWYNAGQGISLRRNDPNYPLLERLANYFQNSWMSMLLFNINGDGVYRFSCDYDRLSKLGEAAPALMKHLVTPDPTTNETLLRGGSAYGELIFEMVDHDGRRVLKPSANQTLLQPRQLSALLQCAHNGAQIYHVGLHVASQSMAYASKDLATGHQDLSQDPVFRMLNPGRDATSNINAAADASLVNVPGFGSRRLNAADMKALKVHGVAPLLADPCNASRYNPRHDQHVTEATLGQLNLFNPTGRRALGIICADVSEPEQAIQLPERAWVQYVRRLRDDLHIASQVEPVYIERYEPPLSAMAIGIEHTMTFSINFLWAELERQPPAEALPFADMPNPRAFGAAFFLDVVASAVITVFSHKTLLECSEPIPEHTQTSITNEQLIVADFPRSIELGYDVKLREMAHSLRALWAETSLFMEAHHPGSPVMNASFVYEVQRCVSSSTWI